MSISTIYQEIKSIYLQKYMKILFEKYSNAKWFEIIIYFPEDSQTNIDEIFNLIQKKTRINQE